MKGRTATYPPPRPGLATQPTTCRLPRTPRRRSSASEDVWGMRTNQPTTKPRTEPRTEPKTAPVSRGIRLAFEWFLELPVQVVLLVLWVAGIVFFGACALLTYMGISALVELVAGAF